jgi:hypothetical protein
MLVFRTVVSPTSSKLASPYQAHPVVHLLRLPAKVRIAIPISLRAAEVGGPAITLMIHQEGGSDFKAQLSSNVPGLSLEAERGPNGDRYQVEITLVSERVRVGPMKGSIIIDTNDAEFPRVIVPVSGQIVER